MKNELNNTWKYCAIINLSLLFLSLFLSQNAFVSDKRHLKLNKICACLNIL